MAIISISGIIGSGKDTAASIIQELTPYHNWQIKKFAGKLKQIASILTNIPVDSFEDQDFKRTILPKDWSKAVLSTNVFDKEGGYSASVQDMSVRDFLQKLGTEAMRDGLHENVWVNALFSDYKCINDSARSSMGDVLNYSDCSFPNWIITDTRFENELWAVKARQGITIKILRDSENTVGTQHASETALNHINDWDYIIENNGTLQELKQKLFDILSEESLIKYTSF